MQAKEDAVTNAVRYHDPAIAADLTEFTSMIKSDGAEAVSALAEQLRFSPERADRARSAVAYAAVAEHIADSDPEKAVYQFHYAGQGFRLEGLTSKAGRNYEKSADLGRSVAYSKYRSGDIRGASKLQDFNCRSIGRAVNCYRDAGQLVKALGCVRKVEVALQDQLVFQQRSLQANCMRVWGLFLDYSLSWSRGAAVLAILMILSLFLPQALANISIALGAIAFLSVCVRRLAG